jgi:hypothetical protein
MGTSTAYKLKLLGIKIRGIAGSSVGDIRAFKLPYSKETA